MQSESGRYINSVSDLLHSTDEIEFLLDDIRDLEPSSCKPEDIQDFEIAGSSTGVLEGGGGTSDCGVGGGCECDSPLGTVNSWDSHSHYRRRPASPDLSLYSGVIVYCDHRHLRTPTGVVRVLLVISTVACLACLCSSGTVKVGLFMLPLVGRLRLMMFVTILSLLVTCLLLFLDISHVIYLFPLNWGKVNAYFYVSLSILFLIASSLIFHMIFLADVFAWVPKWTHEQLLVTGCLGYVCCLESAILTMLQKCGASHYRPVGEDPSNMNLQEHPLQETSPTVCYHPVVDRVTTTNNRLVTSASAYNYKPMIATATTIPYAVPSTSQQHHDTLFDYPEYEVQPCSSKSCDSKSTYRTKA